MKTKNQQQQKSNKQIDGIETKVTKEMNVKGT